MSAADRDYPRIVTPPPGPKGKAIIERDRAYTSTSYIKEYPLVVARGRGAMVEDVDGNRFIDFMAAIAVASTGYSHPLVVKAVQEAAGEFFSMCATDWYYESLATLAERLATLAPGDSKKRVFFTNSGTEAIEGAIKLVRSSSRRRSLIAFDGAFHGRTYGAMSLTSSKVKQRRDFGPFLPGVHHVPFPNPYRHEGRDAGDYVIGCINRLFEARVAPENVAAIFIEPMLGEGGYVLPPPDFLRKLRALCDEHGILLVCDEVQSGVGRTGKMWACEHAGVEPDVVCAAKGIASGMPLGAIIAKESVMKWERGSHGSTYGGNPLACAAALATLELVERQYMANASAMGERFMARLRDLQQRFPQIGDVRGKGLFIGVEFVEDRESKKPASKLVERLVHGAFARGLLLLSCGKSTVRLAPPLCIDAVDVERGMDIFEAVLREVVDEA
ncbi:MAG: acetyl ornithine aminotransferase family protein [Myxococcales bacterium]|nr:acetyl ornithine aminotransferase family protein [Myxococcales bacterium]